jgi:hypothetical protein
MTHPKAYRGEQAHPWRVRVALTTGYQEFLPCFRFNGDGLIQARAVYVCSAILFASGLRRTT